MPRCKAPEILRNEAYLDVRRNDEGRGKRSRWAFFSSPIGIKEKTGKSMKTTALSFLLVLSLAAFSFAEEPKDSTLPRKEKCPVCGMFVSLFPEWNARIEFKDSAYATFDGAKCMFKYYLNIKKYNPTKNKKDILAISVMDYDSKTSIDALQAFFVIWSDVYGPMGHEPIPFEKEADAKKFLKEHKGKKILRFKDINPKLITSLDNP
jgi:nitrous oxide reductase accessory protein NosL